MSRKGKRVSAPTQHFALSDHRVTHLSLARCRNRSAATIKCRA
jgi:hypothetical protein